MFECQGSTKEWRIVSELIEGDPEFDTEISVHFKLNPEISYSVRCNSLNGIPHPKFINMERWAALNNIISYRSSDVIVATFPKCGTTFLEHIILLLLNKGNSSLLNPANKNAYIPRHSSSGKVWIEACVEQDAKYDCIPSLPEANPISIEDFHAMPDSRVIKTHSPINLLLGIGSRGIQQLPIGTKIVVVTRNPFDACVSYYHHGNNPCKQGWSFSAWASLFLHGQTHFGSWFQWTRGWYVEHCSNTDKVHWIHYEDLNKGKREVFQQLAEFLGVPASDDLIDATIEASRFENVKNQADQKGGDIIGHLRKGICGEWKKYFNSQLTEEFIQYYQNEMEGLCGLNYSLGNGETLSA